MADRTLSLARIAVHVYHVDWVASLTEDRSIVYTRRYNFIAHMAVVG